MKRAAGAGCFAAMALPSPTTASWEAETASKVVLALPSDAAAICAPASMPYAVELCGIAGLPPSDGDGPAPTYAVRMSLYDSGTKSMFGRTWESAQLPWPHLDEPLRKADLELAQTCALHTSVVGPSCLAVVEVVRGEGDAAVSVGWSVAPLFPPHGAGRLKGTFGPEVESPVFAGTPRYLLFDSAPPADEAIADCKLRLRVRTFAGMGPYQSLLRENEIVGMADALPGLGGSLLAPAAAPTCSITLSDLSFAIPGVPDSQDVRTSTDISKVDFDSAMMKYLEAVTDPEVWAGSKGVTKTRALVGVHNGHCYIAPRVSVPLTKTEGVAGCYSLGAAGPTVVPGVPLSAGCAVIVSLQMTLDTPKAATTLLIGWVTTCPCDGGAVPAASTCVGPLSRGPKPAPDGCLAVNWGDLEVDEEVKNNNINVTFKLEGSTPAEPVAAEAAAAATPAVAGAPAAAASDGGGAPDAAMASKLVEQQAQIAQLQKKLAAEEERAKSKYTSDPPLLVHF